LIRTEQPRLDEVANEKLIAGHVPEKQRLPFVERDAVLGEHDQRPVTSSRIEPSVQDLGDVPKPRRAASANEVLSTKAVKIFAFRAIEVPRRKDFVGLVNHRALYYSE
jgi:hypothetical protein